MRLPDSVYQLIQELSELPSIGPRQATRLVFYLLSRGPGPVARLAQSFEGLKKIKVCERCFFIHENEDGLCDICRDPNREQAVVMIIEKETDLLSLEKTGKYRGRYFVIGGIPKTGLLEDWQKQRLERLKRDLAALPDGKAKEIISGFNPSAVGDFHAAIIAKELAGLTQKTSRLGRGLPTGGEIEFADDETLGSALERRS